MKRILLLALIALFSSYAYAQGGAQKIEGIVLSGSDSQPMIGVTVVIKDSFVGTATDINGFYSIDAPADATLSFSFYGYQTQDVAVGSKTKVDVTLKESTLELEEVVVVGYGVQKKALVTGANANIKGDDIEKLNPSTAMEGLQGTVPGLSITRNSGAPGAGTKVNIRGMGTIGDSNPLYIVDGVAVSNIDYLNPSDIQSIDVLKDAASAAIYGSRAANGVVLVTTKKGPDSTNGEMRTSITYDGNFGVQNTYKTLPTLNAQEYMAIIDEARMNDGSALFDWESMIKNNTYMNDAFSGDLGTKYGEQIWEMLQNGWEGTDWVDEMSKENAIVQSHSVNIMGNNNDISYAAGFSYYDQEGIIGGDIVDAGYTRITARLNTELAAIKRNNRTILTFGENLTFTNTENRSVGTGGIYDNDLHNALIATPLMMAYWDEPSINSWTNGYGPNMDGIDMDQVNPLAKMYYSRNFNEAHSNNIVGNVYAVLEPIERLKLRSSFGINAWFGNSRGYTPTYQLGSKLSNTVDGATQSAYIGSQLTWTNTATYDFKVNENHSFSLLAGTEMLKNYMDFSVGGSKQNMKYDDMDHAYLDNAYAPTELGNIATWGRDNYASGGGLMSYMGRVSYNYKSKYMMDATFRADGSSNFAEGNRWGYFPSLSAGWNFSEEEFAKDLDFLTSGKLRASWGQNGNQNIANFVYSSNISYKDQGYYFGPDKDLPSIGAVPSNIANPDVTWERSEQLNIGVDLRMLRSRLGFSFDWYNKMTKDWLVQAPILGTFGASAPYINGGDVRNRGVEFSLSWNDTKGDFSYGATVTGAHNKNEVTRLANAEGIINGASNVLSQNTSFVSRVEVGMPIGYFYGYQTDGIFQNQAEVDAYVAADGTPIQVMNEETIARRPGDVRFVDQNGDGIINEEDKVMIGNPNPDFELGLQLNFGYKNFYANATLTGKFGHQVMQSYRSFSDEKTQNYTTQVFDRWHGEGTSNTMPRLSYAGNANTEFISDIYMHDADYLRISNLTLGYNFDNMLKESGIIKRASLYVSVSNLYTFTSYDGMNPEVGYGGGDGWASGIDLGLYPVPRTVSVGLNLTL